MRLQTNNESNIKSIIFATPAIVDNTALSINKTITDISVKFYSKIQLTDYEFIDRTASITNLFQELVQVLTQRKGVPTVNRCQT